MLGTRHGQRGLFEADAVYAGFVGRESFYGWLASERGGLFQDGDFAGLYATGIGRPSVPPSLLATALVLQSYERVSDEEAAERAAYDLRWKVALGVEVEARPFAKSTLQEFRAQLVLREEQRLVFQKSLELAKRRGRLRRDRTLRVALDTTPILGRGAVKDTYNLLADGIVQVLRVLARQAGVRRGDRRKFGAWATAAGYGRYVADVSVKGGAAIDWDDPDARQRFLGEIVADADRVLQRVRVERDALATTDSARAANLVEAAGLLSRVLGQDVTRTQSGPALVVGTAPDRLVSIHDPQMRHGHKSVQKRFDGHKAAVAVDTDSQLITAVEVLAGNGADATLALPMVEQSERATGCAVAATSGDCAFGDGLTRQAFADAGRVLHAQVPAATNQGRLPKTAFHIDLAVGSCTCPAEQTTRDLRHRSGRRQIFFFPATVCAACPLRSQCVRGAHGRTIVLHPQEALLQQARALQASPAFLDVRRRRQTAEHRLARLVQLGIRQARYVGHAKTLFQLAMAATVANLTLLASTANGPFDATTPFTALAAALCLVLAAVATILSVARRHRPDTPLRTAMCR